MKEHTVLRVVVFVSLSCLCGAARGSLEMGPEQLVTADGGVIHVDGYSVPSYVDFNSDGLKDLVVGQGGGYGVGKVRVYLNVGTAAAPQFSSHFFAQANSSDLEVPAMGCLGAFPRVVYWDGDNRKDLLLGQANGKVKVYLNTNTDADPMFDGGTFLEAGAPGAESAISVGYRATPSAVDWDNDGRKDLVAGSYYGMVQVFPNDGTDAEPGFGSPITVQSAGSAMDVGYRSSPVVADLDGDGRKDLLVGDTPGMLHFYSNVGTDDSPLFEDASLVLSDGAVIDLMGPTSARSRPFVTDWTDDGNLDILVGAGDGYVHLFQGVPEPATIVLLSLGAVMLRRKR